MMANQRLFAVNQQLDHAGKPHLLFMFIVHERLQLRGKCVVRLKLLLRILLL